MSGVSPLVCGPVSVTWQADGHVDTITYEGKVLGEVVKARLQSLQLGPLGIALTDEQTDLISNLLNSVALLPSTEIRSKIFLADRFLSTSCLRRCRQIRKFKACFGEPSLITYGDGKIRMRRSTREQHTTLWPNHTSGLVISPPHICVSLMPWRMIRETFPIFRRI